ncbi:reverse transcriptase domain-containing protein [Shewanella algae]|uniref:reverse transcriptase domain-containing protein n=1 Tax=Shewanella algae TaxID=38313 RepID=UPI001F44DDD0|nr:reverse transcriptase domain-containing protein [Shewanella algae]MCE9779115.1 reverse transcriptase/maturase family protein [Shewanella algae]MCE9828552.1 reverse transcriptase/maturase family protein [Shewanella algae]
MSVRKQFEKHFSEENLKRIFTEHVIYSGATGIDNLNQYSFRKQLDEQIQILSRKMLAGSYEFTKYRLKLVSKGRGKIPREIAIPTVRDRIAMRAMCDFLSERFESSLNLELPQNVIASVKKDAYSKKYTGCIKLDVSNFYPSVVHAELESRLKKRVRDEGILEVIQSAISSPTVSISKSSDKRTERGIPQGLAISNVLAAIYLINIDRYMNAYPNISYYRYVDDVLIFCKYKDAESIAREVISRFNKIGLEVHDPIEVPEKSSIGRISKRFDYLGYQFENSLVTARQATVEKLRASLVAIFTSYKHSDKKNENFLVWRLNLRITGCIFENKSKGWLFFFSEINDETLLHSLDHYVKKLIKRFDLKIKPKKFSRAFKELSHRKYETNYIPNFDKYTLDKQKDVLTHYFNMNISKYTDEEVTFAFHKRIGKQVKDLQEDIKDFKY